MSFVVGSVDCMYAYMNVYDGGVSYKKREHLRKRSTFEIRILISIVFLYKAKYLIE